jgi:hypothetical protein
MPARKLICLSLVEHTNGIKIKPTERCADERIPGSRYCAHHLAEAVREWNAILAEHVGEAQLRTGRRPRP